MSRRLLLSAYQCGPGQGSVSQIGWEWYSRLAARIPLTLVTHSRNRAILTAHGAPLGDSEIIYIDTEWFAGPLYRTAKKLFPKAEHAVFLLASLDYYVFDAVALRQLRRRQRSGAQYRLLHTVTPVSPLALTRLHKLDLPLILGPWNGGLKAPPAFAALCQEETGRFYAIREPLLRLTRVFGATRHAAAILAATQATLTTIPPRDRPRCRMLLENGVDLARFPATPWPEPPGGEQPLRLAFVGRLIPVKGVPMLLAAVARLREEARVTLEIVGDGPLRGELEAQAHTLQLTDCVKFLGNQPAAEVAAAMQRAHLFCLPSVRESGGAVLLEAMACARPVVAVAHGGPAEIVDTAVGAALPADGENAVIDGLLTVFRDVLHNPAAWQARAATARQRAEERYGWDAKIAAALAIYNEIAPEAV